MKRERRYVRGLEVRESAGMPPVIRGYAAVFNEVSQPLGGFVEKIKPGAFTKAIQRCDVRALVGHDPDKIIGRTKSGTLSLREDEKGLYYEVQPPDTTAGRDIVESIKRGDIDGSSFGFGVVDDDWGSTEDGQPLRELREVELYDVSPVTYPAYLGTSVAMRALLFPEGVPPDVEQRMDSQPDVSGALKALQAAIELQKQDMASDDEPIDKQILGHLEDALNALGGTAGPLDISGNIKGGGDDTTQLESRGDSMTGGNENGCECDCPECQANDCVNCSDPECDDPECLANQERAAEPKQETRKLTTLEKIAKMRQAGSEDLIADFEREQQQAREEARKRFEEDSKRFDY